ncbi:MAG: hypothetical protein AAF551_02645, partial [Bacteroidota bacterium]
MHWLIEKNPIILPEKYYLDYFHYVLDFVERQYEHILDQPEYLFYQAFRALSEDAQCLYIRLSNRKGNFFRIEKIDYVEIKDLHAAKSVLLETGFVAINESLDLDQFGLFTKSELLALFDFLVKDQRKAMMLEELTEVDISSLHAHEEIIELKKIEEVSFIQLLFFGNREGQMTEFVIRDVGNVKIQQLDESKFKPWFETREEALAVMHVSQLKTIVRQAIKLEFPIASFLEDVPWTDWLSHPRANQPTEKLLLEIAYHFEQRGMPEEALSYYVHSKKHPSRERRIRILQKLGREDE